MYNVAIDILNILYKNGYEAYIIGGYVRDKLLGYISNDIDITTNATSNDLINIFGNVISNNKYGSMCIKYEGYIFDITTFRKDIDSVNNRWPRNVKYVDSINDDILRRDFTINTLCIDYKENIVDILGASSDIKNKVIKSVGDPYIKMKEDSYRILRAVRFACILDFGIENALFNAIKKYSYLLRNISFDRKKYELDLIFKSKNLKYGLDLIKNLNLAKYLEIYNIDKLVLTSNYLGIWAQLDFSNKYNFTKHEKKVINDIKKIIKDKIIDQYTIYKYDFSIIKIAGEILHISLSDINKIYNNMQIHNRSQIDIDISDLKIITSSKIKDIYIDLEKEILYNNLKNERNIILEYINNKYNKES